jgi:OmpA-OmpF porin, OOP family
MSLKQTLAVTTVIGSIVAMAACQASFQASAGGSNTPPPTSGAAGAPSIAASQSSAGAAQTAAAPAAPKLVSMAGGKIVVQGALAFDSGKAILLETSDNTAILDDLKLFLDQNAAVTQMRIEGHTDNVGDANTNLQLSGQRALAVKKVLTDRGVPATRLVAVGFGDKKPIGDNATAEGRAKNQRIDFRVATFNGKNYLNQDPVGGGTKFE